MSPLRWGLAASLFIGAATENIYEKTWNHHGAAFMSMDVAKTVEDYADDARITVVNHCGGEQKDYTGKHGAEEFFTELYSKITGADGTNVLKFADGFEVKPPVVEGNAVFLAWNSSSPSYEFSWGTDTFVMGKDGKFTFHTIYACGRPTVSSASTASLFTGAPTESIYEKTWNHHGEAFMSLDVAKTVVDYADDARIIVINHCSGERKDYTGKHGAKEFFTELYSKITGADGTNVLKFADGFEVKPPVVEGNTVFLAWKSSSPSYEFSWGTDTFAMGKDGKFTFHTIYSCGAPTANSALAV